MSIDATSERSVVPVPSSRRRAPRSVVVLIGLAATSLVVATAWVIVRDRRAADARAAVVVDESGLSCRGAVVEVVPLDDLDPDAGESLLARSSLDMECRYHAVIRNSGGTGVTIERLGFPVLGPAGGPAVEAIELEVDGATFEPRATESFGSGVSVPVDAIFDVDHPLAAGDSTRISLVVVARPDGCTPVEGSIRFRDVPIATIRSHGVGADVALAAVDFGFTGYPEMICAR